MSHLQFVVDADASNVGAGTDEWQQTSSSKCKAATPCFEDAKNAHLKDVCQPEQDDVSLIRHCD